MVTGDGTTQPAAGRRHAVRNGLALYKIFSGLNRIVRDILQCSNTTRPATHFQVSSAQCAADYDPRVQGLVVCCAEGLHELVRLWMEQTLHAEDLSLRSLGAKLSKNGVRKRLARATVHFKDRVFCV